MNFYYQRGAIEAVEIGQRGEGLRTWRIWLFQGNEPAWLAPHFPGLATRIREVREYDGLKPAPDVLERTHWTLFASLGRLKDDRADAAQRFVRELTEAMAADEYAVALGHRLPDLENRAVDLLARPVEPPPPTPPPTPPTPPGKGGASVREGAIVDEGSHSDLDRERLRTVTTRLEALFSEEPTARLELTWKLRKRNQRPAGPGEGGA